MPVITEEKIDRVLAVVDDVAEAVGAQTRAILMLSERMHVQSEILAKIHEAVTKPAGGEPLADILKALVEADQRHAAVLETVLAAVTRKAQ